MSTRSSHLGSLPEQTLRGIAQVFFQDNVLTGVLVLVGLALANPRMAALAALGSVAQTVTGRLTGRQEAAARGLMGYNGALVGAAAALDVPGWTAALVTIVAAALCVPIHAAFAWLLTRGPLSRRDLPVATAPFCTVAGVVHVLAQPAAGGALSGGVALWPGAVHALFNGIAEIFLADGWLVGVLLLAGIALSSWRAAVWGLAGSALAAAIALAAGLDRSGVTAGLFGYSPVLVAMGLGATFRVERRLACRILLVVLGTGLAIVLKVLLDTTGIPVYTWPFVLTLWLVLGGSTR